MNVTLTMIPDDPSSPSALKIVNAVSGVNVDIFYVGEFFAESGFPIPFLRTECGLLYHGIDGIEWFAESMRRRRNKSVQDKLDANLREAFA